MIQHFFELSNAYEQYFLEIKKKRFSKIQLYFFFKSDSDFIQRNLAVKCGGCCCFVLPCTSLFQMAKIESLH